MTRFHLRTLAFGANLFNVLTIEHWRHFQHGNAFIECNQATIANKKKILAIKATTKMGGCENVD